MYLGTNEQVPEIFYNPKNLTISIEPVYMNYIRLLNNLRLNHLPFNNCFNVAASNKEDIIKFDNRTKINYLSQSAKIDPYGKDQIKTVILDNFSFENKNFPINCMKIDTEGYEIEVLEGSKKIIQTYFPDIFIELNERSADKCIHFLKEFGYCCFFIEFLSSNFVGRFSFARPYLLTVLYFINYKFA